MRVGRSRFRDFSTIRTAIEVRWSSKHQRMIARTPCDEKLGAHCEHSEQPKFPGILLAAVVLGSCMAFIDGTVVNVAVPAIQKNFGASLSAMQWVVNGYTLMLGAFILIGGSLGDHLGRRKIFLTGDTLFATASLLCGLAPTVLILIAARIIQGLGGAMLIPQSLAIISAAFPEKERGKAIGVWAAGSAISTAIGPVLGGYLVDHVSWRGAFFINLPIGAVTILLSLKGVPESRNPDAQKIDWLSGAFAALSLGGISYGLIEAPDRGWTKPDVLAALILGSLLLVAFIRRQFVAKNPMAPPELFKSKTFSGVNAMTLLLYGALAGAMFFLPFNLIQVRGYSAAGAGASFLPFAVLMGGFSRWAGGLVQRFGSRPPLVVGPCVVAAGFAGLAFAGNGSYWVTVFPGILLLAAGMTITVAPLTATVMGSIPAERSGTASGINNAVSRIAGLLAIAAMGIVMASIYTSGLQSRTAGIPVQSRQEVERTAGQLLAAPLPEDLTNRDKAAVDRARKDAFLNGYRVVMLLAAGLAALSAAVAAITVTSGKPPSSD
jgi:EmrB/QacA subfamily drug resistance transporter